MRNGFLVFTAIAAITLMAVLATLPAAPAPVQFQVALTDTDESHLHAGSPTDGTTAAVPPGGDVGGGH